jgi:hypothetical protein
MTAYGYNWGDWAFLDYNTGTDIDAVALNDEATLTSDEFSLDGKAACEVGVSTVGDNTGACDGDLYVYVLGYGATGWETISDAPMQAAALDQAQNTTRHASFSIDPAEYSAFKILVDNDCGQQVAVSIKVKTATFDSL